MHVNYFSNYGYFITDLSEQSLTDIKKEVIKIRKNPNAAKSIADAVDGHVESTYHLKDSIKSLEQLISPHFIAYDKKFNFLNANYLVLSEDLKLTMNNAWVSFQNKYDFSPAHKHPGLMSFVIWLDIPYNRKDEMKHSPGKPKRNKAGVFTFYYTDVLGNVETHDILLDQSYKNKMILFPSRIRHSVSPFYSSNSTRVSIAGNVFYKVEK
jgi:hypothetical protein